MLVCVSNRYLPKQEVFQLDTIYKAGHLCPQIVLYMEI